LFLFFKLFQSKIINMKDEIMSFNKILEIIVNSAKRKKTVEIYYPRTQESPEGWREIEAYAITTDIGNEGEELVYGKDIISPGHILKAYTIGGNKNYCNSFILGKIQEARITRRDFIFKKNWKVKF